MTLLAAGLGPRGVARIYLSASCCRSEAAGTDQFSATSRVRVVSIPISRRCVKLADSPAKAASRSLRRLLAAHGPGVQSDDDRLDPTHIHSANGPAPERRGAVVSRVQRPRTGRSQRAGEPQPRCRSARPPRPPIALPALRRCWAYPRWRHHRELVTSPARRNVRMRPELVHIFRGLMLRGEARQADVHTNRREPAMPSVTPFLHAAQYAAG
jgi:hypothetical protein